ATVVLALGPIIGRIRRLTQEVRRSARSGYADPVALRGSDELAELSRAFDEAGREIRTHLAQQERRELALRHFLANTTHDVMIPLTVLLGHLAALAKSPGDRDTVAAAMSEAHYLASLMHNLAAAAKLEAGEPAVRRDPLDLRAVVEQAVARHQAIARQREVALEAAVPERPIRVDGDVTLLEQAIGNVVYNAIRHNRAAGHVADLLE